MGYLRARKIVKNNYIDIFTYSCFRVLNQKKNKVVGRVIETEFYSYSCTITYKSNLTPKKMYNKTDAIFSIYGKNGINP